MTIETTAAALQVINGTITGMGSAPSVFPGSINTADMPLSIVWPGPGSAHLKGLGFNAVDRIYRVTVYVMPVDQGLGIDEGWTLTMQLIQRFHDAYLLSTNNPLVTGTYSAWIKNSLETPILDGGLEVFAYPPPVTGIEGIPHYYGFEMNVPVLEHWSGG